MRYRKPRLSRKLRLLALPVALWAASIPAARADGPPTKPGDIILYCQPGTPLVDAQALAAKVNPASVTPLLLEDCYHIVLPQVRATDVDTAQAVATLKASPKTRWVGASRIYKWTQSAGVTPNDPRYPEQYGLKLIRMPEAWTIQKGSPSVTFADIDSGFDPKHVDMVGKYSSGSYDFGDNDADITADGSDGGTGIQDHGVSTASVSAAATNNGIGIAGVVWEQGLQIVGLKAQKKGVASGPDTTALLNSYAYIKSKATDLKIVAVNMSYGAHGATSINTSDPEYVALKALSDAGIILVAAAGNDGDTANPNNTFDTPSGYPFVISVGAVNRNGRRSNFSSYGKVDIAAPGGEITSDNDPNGILLHKINSGYAFEQGTSFACPHVTGVAALMMSNPGVTSTIAINAMLQTANPGGLGLTTLPDPKYGYGLIDAYSALARVATRLELLDPYSLDSTGNPTSTNGIPPALETYRPTFRVRVTNVDVANLTVTVDGTAYSYVPGGNVNTLGPTQYTVEAGGVTTGTGIQYNIVFRPLFSPAGSASSNTSHTILVNTTKPAIPANSATGQAQVPAPIRLSVTITPHQFASGLSMISIPYYEKIGDRLDGTANVPGEILGTDTTLFRYDIDAALGSNVTPGTQNDRTAFGYAIYDIAAAGAKNPNASFTPLDVRPAIDTNVATSDPSNLTALAASNNIAQVGVGYFVRTTGTSVTTYGQTISQQPFRIQLHPGWNMVGDPYNYAVPFNTTQIETPTGQRYTIQQAVDQNLMLPFLYRYSGGSYVFDALPSGNFQPWQSNWIFVNGQTSGGTNTQKNTLTMIFAPTPANTVGSTTRAIHGNRGTSIQSVAPSRVSGAGSWSVQLVARAKDQVDSGNYIGMSSNATDGEDKTKAPKPPMPTRGLSLGILRPNSRSAVYAQDLRSVGGAKTWDVVVNSEQTNTDVALSWPDVNAIPRNYRLTLTDKTNGQTVDLKRQSVYTFNTGSKAAAREFTITAKPVSAANRVLISNLFINPGATRAVDGSQAFEIGYNVSEDAKVEATIMTFGGKVMTQIGGGTRAVAGGGNKLVWNGRDNVGRQLPSGPYMLQITAVGSDGQTMSRAIAPFNLTR